MAAPTHGPFPRLHVLTPADQRADDLRTLDAVLEAGAPAVQVRVKDRADRDHLDVARAVVGRCRAAGATCVVNDRVDIALAAGADGVHLGLTDLPVAAARELAGERLLIGGTARDPATARRLAAEGADYLGAGPTFATRTKDGLPEPLGPARVGAIAAAVGIPVLAISGITAERLPQVLDTGVHGVAVTGAVMDAPDPAAATTQLLALLAGPSDAGLPDAGLPDAARTSAGRPNAGRPSAGRPSAGQAGPGTKGVR